MIRNLLSIGELTRADIEEILELAGKFAEVLERPIPKVPTLRGRTVVNAFFEDSTRTRLSFETAAKRLSADVMNFSSKGSAVEKGESLRDTVETLEAMGVDAFVVRHSSSGAPWQIASWVDAAVINGGDGTHQHPTQALLDAYTALQHLHTLEGRRIAIVGDIVNSRVARSDVDAFTELGASVCLVGPPTLLPRHVATWPVDVSYDIDSVLPELDAVYMLRVQKERGTGAGLPSMREYAALYGLDARRARLLPEKALIMHPGPMIRGVEISPEVAALPNAVITQQVANGVAVRMAVLFALLRGGPR
jgi:aspartate carbamoyltransferase catalytic subunit